MFLEELRKVMKAKIKIMGTHYVNHKFLDGKVIYYFVCYNMSRV